MNRRKSISLIATGSLLFTQKVFPSVYSNTDDAGSEEKFMKAFFTRWEVMKLHTFEVFEAMPDAEFSFQPAKEMMSFAKLFSHIGFSLGIFSGILDNTPHKEERESVEKEVVLTYLKTQFKRFETVFTQLNPDDLYNAKHKLSTIDGEIEWSDYDILTLAYNHTVHHKGQATTYLRLKEIVPPQYRC